MDVLSYKSTDGLVAITVSTAADMANCWRRFSVRVGEKATTYCNYRSTIAGRLSIAMPSLHHSLEEVGEGENTQWCELPPVFYETAVYNVSIYLSCIEHEPSVIHKLKEVAELFTAINVGESKWVLTAPLSFLNEPGIFNLSFKYKPIGQAKRTDTFAFRVVSPKLDTKDDYRHILNEINREYNEIVFQYLTKTVQNLDRGGRTNNDVIWLSIFRQVIDGYIKAVSYITMRPHLQETTEVHFSHADRIKRWTPKMAQRYAQSESRGTLGHDYFRHEVTINTNDTAENRFVKFTLGRISQRLEYVFKHIRTHNKEITEAELNTFDEYALKLRKLSNSPLLRRLKAEPMHNESIVLQKRTGYSQVYRCWIILQKGIELYDGSTQIGVRPIWELYELWCFLKMRQMVAKILDLHFGIEEEIVEKPMPMIEPFTENKQEHTVFYYKDGDEIRLHYQHTYNRSSGEVHTATTDNRPDIVLTIRKPDGFELTYLFDAKYRVCDDNEFSKEDKDEINALHAADYPPSDAINQMHRYRDAIYYGDKVGSIRQHSAKEIIGGYILFPGRGDDQAVRNRYFFKSIKTVNIGAFPLLPDHNDPDNEGSLLYEHLTKILTEQSAYEQIRDAVPQHGLVYTRSITESNDLVLVGYFKAEQKEVILKNKLYYVPAGLGKGSINIVSGFENAKYLLLHHDKDRILLELKGNGPKFFTANTLADMGFEPSGDYYLGFEIKSLKSVEIDGFDINAINLHKAGKQSYKPYFITFKEFKELPS
mgnify:CR=1 FL=1